MTTDPIAALKAAAEKVEQKKWELNEKPSGGFWRIGIKRFIDGIQCGVQAIADVYSFNKNNDPELSFEFKSIAEFIAQANPSAILALIERFESAEKDADKWKDYVANRNKSYDRQFVAVFAIEGLTKNNELLSVRYVVDRDSWENSRRNEILRTAERAAVEFDAAMIAEDGK